MSNFNISNVDLLINITEFIALDINDSQNSEIIA